MKRTMLQVAILLCACHEPAWAAGKFESVSVYLEQTVEDGDSEVTVDAITGSEGLTELKVVAPDGRTVVSYKAGESKLGMRHLTLESPEPKNDGSVKADFPAGLYRLIGTVTTGATVEGEATLSHKFPDAARLVHPRPDEKNVPVTRMQIKWNTVKDAATIVLVIEQEKTRREFKVDLPGSATTFTLSDGFLAPGLEYKLAIGTVARDGNRSFTETSFLTAARKP
jgi:hypothetical protein